MEIQGEAGGDDAPGDGNREGDDAGKRNENQLALHPGEQVPEALPVAKGVQDSGPDPGHGAAKKQGIEGVAGESVLLLENAEGAVVRRHFVDI